MIFDKIQNWKLYFKDSLFDHILEEFENYSEETQNGVYKNNENYYFKVMDYNTSFEPKIIESHKKEVDIQIILKGGEKIKLYNPENLKIIKEYSEETDCIFYEALGKHHSEIILSEGCFAVFFPDDIHQPQFALDNEIKNLKKIVIKVNEKLFS